MCQESPLAILPSMNHRSNTLIFRIVLIDVRLVYLNMSKFGLVTCIISLLINDWFVDIGAASVVALDGLPFYSRLLQVPFDQQGEQYSLRLTLEKILFWCCQRFVFESRCHTWCKESEKRFLLLCIRIVLRNHQSLSQGYLNGPTPNSDQSKEAMNRTSIGWINSISVQSVVSKIFSTQLLLANEFPVYNKLKTFAIVASFEWC